MRALFVRTEQEQMQYSHASNVSGFVFYAQSGAILCLHEYVHLFMYIPIYKAPFRASTSSDFQYKHDAQHNLMFLTAQIWNDSDDEVLCEEFISAFTAANTGAEYCRE